MGKENIKIIILKYLQTTDVHPTGNEIYNELNKLQYIDEKEFQAALFDLEDNGRISYTLSTDNLKHYDIRLYRHHHFICDDCGAVRDIFIRDGALQMLIDHAQRSINSFGKITKVNLSFQGRCHNCKIQFSYPPDWPPPNNE